MQAVDGGSPRRRSCVGRVSNIEVHADKELAPEPF